MRIDRKISVWIERYMMDRKIKGWIDKKMNRKTRKKLNNDPL